MELWRWMREILLSIKKTHPEVVDVLEPLVKHKIELGSKEKLLIFSDSSQYL